MILHEEIKHYASMGMSMRATAEVVGITYDNFKSIVRDEGLRHLFIYANYARDCKGGGYGRPRGSTYKKRKKYNANVILLELRKYPFPNAFRSMADINESTVIRRFGSFRLAFNFAHTVSPSDPYWHYVAREADRLCSR